MLYKFGLQVPKGLRLMGHTPSVDVSRLCAGGPGESPASAGAQPAPMPTVWDANVQGEDAGSGYSGVDTGRRFRLAGFAIKSAPISVGTSSAFTEI